MPGAAEDKEFVEAFQAEVLRELHEIELLQGPNKGLQGEYIKPEDGKEVRWWVSPYPVTCLLTVMFVTGTIGIVAIDYHTEKMC